MLIRIHNWSKDRTKTTLPVSRRGKCAHEKYTHMLDMSLRSCTNERDFRRRTLFNVPVNAAVSQAASPFCVNTMKGAPGDTCPDIYNLLLFLLWLCGWSDFNIGRLSKSRLWREKSIICPTHMRLLWSSFLTVTKVCYLICHSRRHMITRILRLSFLGYHLWFVYFRC